MPAYKVSLVKTLVYCGGEISLSDDMPYKNKEKQKEAVKAWKEANKSRVKKVQHKYYTKHKSKFKKPLKHTHGRKTTHLTSGEFLTKKAIWKYSKKKREMKK